MRNHGFGVNAIYTNKAVNESATGQRAFDWLYLMRADFAWQLSILH